MPQRNTRLDPGEITILVIDDEQTIRDLAERILVKAGYTVLIAESGEEGLNLLKLHRDSVELAVIDMTMEGWTGLETLRELRKVNPDLAGIVSSGLDIKDQIIPKDLAQNTSLLQKPYRSQQLTDKVAEVIKGLRTASS
ncbi:MAG: response regulator [Candidatus Zixiibacteriota bacterium]|nr:MAG: response regulator [candidate division Zixibacteria bacterium]